MKYHSEDALYELDAQVAALEAENERLADENARLRAALTGIQTMADEDIREGTEGVFTWQIEADARAALAGGGE